MISIEQIEKILEAFSLEEILELNDLTEAEALYLLEDFIEFPNPRPVDYDTPS